MRKGKQYLSVFLVFVIMMTMVGTSFSEVSADNTPIIDESQADMQLPLGSKAIPKIKLSGNVKMVSDVSLELWISYYNDWVYLMPCAKEGETSAWSIWFAEIDSDSFSVSSITIRFRVDYDYGQKVIYSDPFTVSWSDSVNDPYDPYAYSYNVARIFGRNRYETAYYIADRMSAGTGTYVIASGTDFADALGASWMCEAGAASATHPLYLVNQNSDNIHETAKIIADRHTSANNSIDPFIYIMGGPAAVSYEMESALKENGLSTKNITRFAGANRYYTNYQMLMYKFKYDGCEELLVCSGTGFADALSASALGYGIMLVGKNLTDYQIECLKAYREKYNNTVTIIGGPGVVSQEIEDYMRYSLGIQVKRVFGANRYETSAKIAETYFKDYCNHVVFAFGRNFPDGLAGGTLAQRYECPLLLVDDQHYKEAESFITNLYGQVYAYVLGGPTLISDATVKRIMEMADL